MAVLTLCFSETPPQLPAALAPCAHFPFCGPPLPFSYVVSFLFSLRDLFLRVDFN